MFAARASSPYGGKWGALFTCGPQHAAPGFLAVDLSVNIGLGTFKTAHIGHLTLTHLVTHRLGTRQNNLVAVKRLYYKRDQKAHSSDGPKLRRFSALDKYVKILQEAHLLFWGASIMAFTYSSIRHLISQATEEPLFTIPELRFVHAGVAVVHEQVNGTNVANMSCVRRTYLVEGFIDTGTEPQEFIKFIHNGDAVPLLPPDNPPYGIAEFLCFTQHV
ncbi:hypothetical protein FB451DRAFT_1552817 [Mycena latifolia]|nr:hypothetical protein FB451DRAFT_1552817 [Mycena latifolia]